MVEDLPFCDWVRERIVVDGLVSVYKPYGVPSTALTEMYKMVTGQKVGHGGTLDPLAEGAMLLGIGKGTKLLTKYLESEKRYRASILVGASSESGDLELPVKVSESAFTYTPKKLVSIFEELSRGFTQELPALSAAKQHGKSTYALVREGKPTEKRFVETKLLEWKIINEELLSAVDLQQLITSKSNDISSALEVFSKIGSQIGYHSRKYLFMKDKWMGSLAQSVEIVKNAPNANYLLVNCEVLVPKGTYIRSLAQDIASRMGSNGMLVGLERMNAGIVDTAHSY